MIEKKWVVYLVQCSDKSLYCGISNNLKKRLTAHNSGQGAKYTRSRRPVYLVGTSSCLTKSHALKLEYRVKQVPAGKKLDTLLKGEATLSADVPGIYSIKEDLRMLSMNIEKLMLRIEKIEKQHLKDIFL